jgi:hypothetical protein
MKIILQQSLLCFMLEATSLAADSTRKVISLNGTWEIEKNSNISSLISNVSFTPDSNFFTISHSSVFKF